MALSPWPETPAALAAATATLRGALGAGLEDQRVQALGASASALVENFAPSAPDAIRDEALIRTAGWLCQSPSGGQREEVVGEISTTFTPSATGALRHSGAMALLTVWRARRGGTIG